MTPQQARTAALNLASATIQDDLNAAQAIYRSVGMSEAATAAFVDDLFALVAQQEAV